VVENKFPKNVQIEIGNYCNLFCSTCPVSRMKRKRQPMDFELFKKIIDELSANNFSGAIAPFLNGETFLTPKFEKYLHYIRLKLPKAKLSIYTNGKVLPVLNIDIDELGISFIDAIYGNVVKKIEDFRKKNPHTDISINVVYTGTNGWMVGVLEEIFPDIQVSLRKRFNYAGQYGKYKEHYTRLGKFFYKRNICSRFEDVMTILVDGRVCLCCFDYEGKIIFGDLNKNTIREIWNNEKFENTRKNFKIRKYNELCSKCDVIEQNLFLRTVERMIRVNPLYTHAKNLWIKFSIR